jgi:hypothetical protein
VCSRLSLLLPYKQISISHFRVESLEVDSTCNGVPGTALNLSHLNNNNTQSLCSGQALNPSLWVLRSSGLPPSYPRAVLHLHPELLSRLHWVAVIIACNLRRTVAGKVDNERHCEFLVLLKPNVLREETQLRHACVLVTNYWTGTAHRWA